MAWNQGGKKRVVAEQLCHKGKAEKFIKICHIFSIRSGRGLWQAIPVWQLFWETHSRYSPGKMKSGTLSSVKLRTYFFLKRVQPSQDRWIFCRWCCSLASLWEGGNLGSCHQIQWQHNFSSLLLISWLNSLHIIQNVFLVLWDQAWSRVFKIVFREGQIENGTSC